MQRYPSGHFGRSAASDLPNTDLQDPASIYLSASWLRYALRAATLHHNPSQDLSPRQGVAALKAQHLSYHY